MIRFLLWLLGGVLLGGVVHLATVLLLPRMATQDAYSRLAPLSVAVPQKSAAYALINIGSSLWPRIKKRRRPRNRVWPLFEAC